MHKVPGLHTLQHVHHYHVYLVIWKVVLLIPIAQSAFQQEPVKVLYVTCAPHILNRCNENVEHHVLHDHQVPPPKTGSKHLLTLYASWTPSFSQLFMAEGFSDT